MTKMFYLTRIGPCGVATGLDIGLGNTSLQFITLTFYSKSLLCRRSPIHPSIVSPATQPTLKSNPYSSNV